MCDLLWCHKFIVLLVASVIFARCRWHNSVFFFFFFKLNNISNDTNMDNSCCASQLCIVCAYNIWMLFSYLSLAIIKNSKCMQNRRSCDSNSMRNASGTLTSYDGKIPSIYRSNTVAHIYIQTTNCDGVDDLIRTKRCLSVFPELCHISNTLYLRDQRCSSISA